MAEARRPRRRNTTGKPAKKQPPDPTPKQIADRIAEIQKGWTESIRRKRLGRSGDPVPYEIPVIEFLDNQYWGIRANEDKDGEE